MKTIGKYQVFLNPSILAALGLLLILFFAVPAISGLFSYEVPSSKQPESTADDGLASPQPTIAEPTNSSESSTAEFTGFNEEIPGVGAFFNEMLDTLIGLTSNSEKRFQTLAEHFPLIFNDLYKVFITL